VTFKIVEIRQIDGGMGINLSVKLEPVTEPRAAQSLNPHRGKLKYGLQALLPHTDEFNQLQIGQKFKLERLDE
jgi:hypothetical protein